MTSTTATSSTAPESPSMTSSLSSTTAFSEPEGSTGTFATTDDPELVRNLREIANIPNPNKTEPKGIC